METKKFRKMLKDYKGKEQKLIYLHCYSKLTLTASQLNQVIKQRDKKKCLKVS